MDQEKLIISELSTEQTLAEIKASGMQEKENNITIKCEFGCRRHST